MAYSNFREYCMNDVMYTKQFYRRSTLAMDNPESSNHWRYQIIVNRYALAFISCMIMLLCAEVGGHWYSAGIFPLVIVFGYMSVTLVGVVTWIIVNIAESIDSFFKGY